MFSLFLSYFSLSLSFKCFLKHLAESFSAFHDLLFSEPPEKSLTSPNMSGKSGQAQFLNRPFYSCVLSDLSLDWKRGWG